MHPEYRPDPKQMTHPLDEVIAHSNNPAGDAEKSVGNIENLIRDN
jgi:hypothetical protein